uniref:Uncharacterized protein n=1 Tax=Engystomops pustulosus TaxID=76066 RepID=A0AAV6YD93_ENGPU|nr:hypothetical protein GDO81_028361 [Engystomops pustulosus]
MMRVMTLSSSSDLHFFFLFLVLLLTHLVNLSTYPPFVPPPNPSDPCECQLHRPLWSRLLYTTSVHLTLTPHIILSHLCCFMHKTLQIPVS